jgi:ubiquitin-conjugating enzyme E2 D/E
MDAKEGSTKLYDAIFDAACYLLDFAEQNAAEIAPNCSLRVFALTDGDDNASQKPAWQVAQFLQQKGVILDALPLAGANQTLQAMATATGGLSMHVSSEQQGMALFEREAVLHNALREAPSTRAPPVTDARALDSLKTVAAVVEEVQSRQPAGAKAKVLSTTEASAKVATVASSKSGSVTAAQRRVLHEYSSFERDPPGNGIGVHITEDDFMVWKISLPGPMGTPYEGGVWTLLVQFPADYPFKPPRVRFLTPIYHCNVNNDGGICLDILKDSWSPALSVVKVALSIHAMMGDPNADDPLDAFKAQVRQQGCALQRPQSVRSNSAVAWSGVPHGQAPVHARSAGARSALRHVSGAHVKPETK